MAKLFGADDVRPADGLMRKCKHCGDEGPHPVHIEERGPHYARALCWECSRFVDFVKKPENEDAKGRRPSSHQDLVAKFGRGYCEMCGIMADDAPRGFEFQAHHVVPYHVGGESTRENIWILCTPCHDTVEVRREYAKQMLTLAGKFTAWKHDS